VYRDASVRLDSYSDLLAAYAERRDRDVLADQERFSNPSRQYKHGGVAKRGTAVAAFC
jgi:hypothetical protein